MVIKFERSENSKKCVTLSPILISFKFVKIEIDPKSDSLLGK